MDLLLQRIEALPRAGDYAVTLVSAGGQETTVLMTATEHSAAAPAASLPAGWSPESPDFQAVALAVAAVHRARSTGSAVPRLCDVPGGWDVGLGNVTLSDQGGVLCSAHGPMAADGESTFGCTECGARAQLGDTK